MDQSIAVYKEKMSKTISVLKTEYASVRAGKANPAVLERITVDYYGVPTIINQLATVSTPEARLLVIQPYDSSTLKSIEKAIQASDLGINPTNDGRVLRLTFPQPTEERRKELTKQVRKMAEDSKVALRSIRRDALETFKKQQKASEITEDDYTNLENSVKKLIDEKTKEIDEISSAKEKEIMEI